MRIPAWVAVCVVGFVGLGVDACGSTSKPPNGNGDVKQDDPPPAKVRAEFDLIAFGRTLGTIAPCGCTTEPLGGVQYAFGYLAALGDPKARVVVEPGSLLYPDPQGADWPKDEAGWLQAHDRAGLLTTRFASVGDRLVGGVGPTDVASPDGTAPLGKHVLPRVLANVSSPAAGLPQTPAHRIVELSSGGIAWKVGVTAVVDPALPGADKLGTVDAAEAALSKEVAAMREAGAGFTVALAQGTRPFAEGLAQQIDGLDLIVVGIPEGTERTRLGSAVTQLGGTYILEPGEQLQTVSKLHLSVDAGEDGVPPLSGWTIVPPASSLKSELERVRARIKKFEADPDAEKAFIDRLREEEKNLQSQLDGEVQGGAVATFEQVKITCKLQAQEAAAKALKDYDGRVAAANKERFKGVKPPVPKRGKSGFAGVESCADCHEEAVEFWKTTVHAGAYETLVVDNKQFDLDCVGCHVTGFRQPGGSEVVENEGLIDVQCETCHGAGELHVSDGGDNLKLIRRDAPAQMCASECHTPEHSDTFEYDAYTRDILGPGHGEEARKQLGDGPTGHELRQAGLAKAGGPCKKL